MTSAKPPPVTAPPSSEAEIASAIESILFIAGRPLESADLARLIGVPEERLRAGLDWLAAECARQGRGIRLQRLGEQAQLVSAPENARFVGALLGMPTQVKLTTAALETLAIIAYRQPITRGQLEDIRGVNCDRALATLVQYGLAAEMGRAATVGRPVLFGTTLEFLQQFGLASLHALPAAAPDDELEARRTRDAGAIRGAVTAGDSASQPPLPLAGSAPPDE